MNKDISIMMELQGLWDITRERNNEIENNKKSILLTNVTNNILHSLKISVDLR